MHAPLARPTVAPRVDRTLDRLSQAGMWLVLLAMVAIVAAWAAVGIASLL